MYQNYIFDLYGTLADTHTNEKKAYLWKKMADIFSSFDALYEPLELRRQYERYCAEAEKEMNSKYAEIHIETVFNRLFLDKGVTVNAQMIEMIGHVMRVLSRDYIKLYPGVMEFFLALKAKGKGVYLLSNAQRIFTESELKVLGIYDLFDGIYISSDKGIKKPDPKFMEQLLDEFHLNKKESIMIGNDCSSDVAVANACQMDSLFIQSNISPALPKEIPATYAITDGDFTKVITMILK